MTNCQYILSFYLFQIIGHLSAKASNINGLVSWEATKLFILVIYLQFGVWQCALPHLALQVDGQDGARGCDVARKVVQTSVSELEDIR